MYCKKCGKRLRDDDVFCSACGTKVDRGSARSFGSLFEERPETKPVKPAPPKPTTSDGHGFHLNDVIWDVDGYPGKRKRSDDIDFNWSTISSRNNTPEPEPEKDTEMTEEELFVKITSEDDYAPVDNNEFNWDLGSTTRIKKASQTRRIDSVGSRDFVAPFFNKPEEPAFDAESTEFYYTDEPQPPQPEPVSAESFFAEPPAYTSPTQADALRFAPEADVVAEMKEGIAEASRRRRAPIDKFYTFNKKNEEFQALLDREYERLRARLEKESDDNTGWPPVSVEPEPMEEPAELIKTTPAVEEAPVVEEESVVEVEEEAPAVEEEPVVEVEEEAPAVEEEPVAEVEEEAPVVEEEPVAEVEEEAPAVEEEPAAEVEEEAPAVEEEPVAEVEEEAPVVEEEPVAEVEEEAPAVEEEPVAEVEEEAPAVEEEPVAEVEEEAPAVEEEPVAEVEEEAPAVEEEPAPEVVQKELFQPETVAVLEEVIAPVVEEMTEPVVPDREYAGVAWAKPVKRFVEVRAEDIEKKPAHTGPVFAAIAAAAAAEYEKKAAPAVVVEEEPASAVVVEEEAAPAVAVEEEAAPAVAVEEEAAPAVIVEEEAAPAVVIEEEAAPAVVLEEEPAPAVVVEEEAAPTVVIEEEPAPTVVVEEEAAPAVVVEEEAAPVVVVEEELAPTVVVEEEAAPAVVVEEEAAPAVVVEEEPAPTVVIEENAAEEVPVEDDYEARLEELNRTLEGLAGGPIAEATDEPVAKAAEKAEEAKELVDVEELFAEEEAAAPTRQTAESTAESAALKKGQTGQLRYRDIFNDDDVDDRRGGRKGGRLKIFLLDLLILILAILVVCSAILVFFEGSPVANTLQKGIDTIIAKVTGEEPEAAEAATEEPALSMVQKAINDSLNRNSNGNLKEIAEDTALTFKEGITYDVRGIGDSTSFNDSQWYTNASGQAVNYSDEIVGTVVSYYSSLLDRINSGSDTVLSLIDPDSQLYGTVSAISGDGVVKRGIDVLQFGSIRENTKEGNRDYYALIRVAETEEGKDGAEVSTKVVHLKAGDKAMMIEEIADVINM